MHEVDFDIKYVRNPEVPMQSTEAGPAAKKGSKGAAAAKLQRFPCCLTQKRTCTLGKSGERGTLAHILIWEVRLWKPSQTLKSPKCPYFRV